MIRAQYERVVVSINKTNKVRDRSRLALFVADHKHLCTELIQIVSLIHSLLASDQTLILHTSDVKRIIEEIKIAEGKRTVSAALLSPSSSGVS